MQKPSSDPNIFQNCSLSDPWIKWPISQLKKRARNTSGIDFARSDLSPGLLCELVLKDELTFHVVFKDELTFHVVFKDELTFHVPALEIFPKTRATLLYNRGYGFASGIFKPLSFADQNFGKILDPLQTNGEKFFENTYPKMPGNEFIAVYLCIIEKIS